MSGQSYEAISREEVEIFLKEFNDKINGYILSLKKQSSEEILNGSAQKAQLLLNKVIRVEDGVKNVTASHNMLFGLLNDDSSVQSSIKQNDAVSDSETQIKSSESDKNVFDNKSLEESVSVKYRKPLLKALIYLGGNAKEEDILEFVYKEVKKKLTDEELSVNGDGKTKLWIRDLREDSDVMVSEGLINKDTDVNTYEITQSGIDYLAKNDE